jgi:hypothetical protein
MPTRWLGLMAVAAVLLTGPISSARAEDAISTRRVDFDSKPGRVEIRIGGQAVATYVYNDTKTLRPYFEHLKTTGGVQVTRNHPPVPGKDAVDHPDMHPGLWLAFGDLAGNDFWRNKGPRVEHERFAQEPSPGDGRGVFAVVNRYVANDKVLCRQATRYSVFTRPGGYVILWDSTFTPEADGLWFGNQEEMGLGVRVATPLTVKTGSGKITNNQGGVNEKGTWGRAADWADYTGTIDARQVGVPLINDPAAEHMPWFHTRDYGVLVANPFGPRAGGPDRLPLTRDKPLRLRFAVFVHDAPADAPLDFAREYTPIRKLFQ